MSNGQQNNNDGRRHRFPHSFNIGTTILSRINHAFSSSNNVNAGGQGDNNSENRPDGATPLEPTNPMITTPYPNPVDTVGASSSVVADPPLQSASVSAEPPPQIVPTSHSQPGPQRDDDEDSMPDLSTVSESSDESDAGAINSNQTPLQPVDDDHDSTWTDEEEELPPLEPITGNRRARVEDDVDDARDRRHPSERVGGSPPPSTFPLPQPSDPQQPPLPAGNPNADLPGAFFPRWFGLNPWGGNAAGEDVPMEHTGEDTANPPLPGNNPNPGGAPRGIPILTAGFTFTIPLTGPAPGNQNGTGPTGGPQGLFGADATAREEFFASFAAFFQEVQNLHDEPQEDPERAKKLIAGLEVVPHGLVKRLERVGGAPGGHVDGSSAEGSPTGCAICWDTLLDAESDGFRTQESSGAVPQSSSSGAGQNETSDSDAMDLDPTPTSHSEPAETSTIPASTPLPSEVIALPCAHVFHASCLLPWFTRAKQATCPTCRFNIDPENLTYSPPRRTFNFPGQPNNATPNAAPATPQAAQEVPLGTIPPINPVPVPADAPTAAPSGPAFPFPIPQAGPQPAGRGFNPIHAFPFPGAQIPLRPADAQATANGNNGMPPLPPLRMRTQSLPNIADNRPFVPAGIDIVTIGFDMILGGPPPGEGGGGGGNAGAGAREAGGADGGGNGNGAGGGGPQLPQEIQSLIEGLLRTTRNFPQMMNPRANPVPADGAPPPAMGPQPQPQATGPQPVPPAGGPQMRPNFFRPTRPMPPRQRKTWTLPPAPGPSLRQRVEQREREAGLRCSDTSCGIGPSDEDPFPQSSPWSMKQVSIHPIPHADHQNEVDTSVCAHIFHPACLVIAERVAGWGGEDKTEPLVEVSCPVCRAVGCMTRNEWEEGASSL
jgi:hypothetical protein